MIKMQNSTPRVYSKESRDFQYIGRLFDLILNYSKTNSDLIYALPISDNADKQFLDLLASTLGFKEKHHYSEGQLAAICSVIPLIIKNKGSVFSIKTAANTLLHSEGITEEASIEYKINTDGSTDYGTIEIFIPAELSTTNLFEDLLEYIMPAGISFNIVRSTKTKTSSTSTITNIDIVRYGTDKGSKVSMITDTSDENMLGEVMAGNIASIEDNSIVPLSGITSSTTLNDDNKENE